MKTGLENAEPEMEGWKCRTGKWETNFTELKKGKNVLCVVALSKIKKFFISQMTNALALQHNKQVGPLSQAIRAAKI